MLSDQVKNRIITERLKEMGFHLHPPDQTLYKYVSIARAKQILLENTVRYPPPSEFNDPLDPHLALVDMTEFIRLRGKALSEQINPDDYVKSASSYSKGVLRKYVNTTGILCLTTSNTHTLMWSHYADKHTGICIGFKHLTAYADGRSAYKVKYADEVKPLPFLYPVNQDENFIAMINLLCTKARVWEYEQEVRIPAIGKAGIRPLHPGYVCEIYFGVNTPENEIQEIGQLLIDKGCKNKLEKIGQMMLPDNKFDLEIKSLSF